MATILLIDDKPGIRQVLAEELAFQGYTVMVIGSVAPVNEIIRFSNLDLVIMDPYMKGQHRWDLLQDIKRQDPHLPVLIVTEFPSYRRDSRSALAVGILVKDFDLDDLSQKVAEVFQQKSSYPYRKIRLFPKFPPYPIQNLPSNGDPTVLIGLDGQAAMNVSFP